MDGNRGFRLAWLSAMLMVVVSTVFLLMASSVMAHAAGDTLKPGDHDFTITVGGTARTYRLYLPAKYPTPDKKALPVVVMLHGAGGAGAQVEKETGWTKKADDELFVAVFPDALPANPAQTASFRLNPRFWSDHSGRGNAAHGKINDVAFLNAVLDDVEKRVSVDTKREFLTGFSSGASMTFLAAAKMGGRLAAAAPVSGHVWEKGATEGRAVPLLLIFGTKDPLNPWEGGAGVNPWGGRDQSKPKIMDTVNAWAVATGCPLKPIVIEDKNGVKRLAYGPGKNGAEFLFITIDGMGHTWPGGKGVLPERLVGAPTNKLNATDTIWMFFSRHFLASRSVSATTGEPSPADPAPSKPAAEPKE